MAQSAADELEIRSLVSRYADAVCRRDETAWSGTWSQDSKWTLPMATAEGRNDIVALWVQAMAGFSVVLQFVYNGHVAVHGDQARGTWYLGEKLVFNEGQGMETVGVYHDVYVREADGWRFAERHYATLFSNSVADTTAWTTNAVPGGWDV